MSLSARFSVFFLAVLGVVLLGFSTVLYFLARVHLYGELDDRLHSAMHALVVAAELDEQGLEWDLTERRLSLGRDRDRVLWQVCDPTGVVLDGSRGAEPAALFAAQTSPSSVGLQPKQSLDHEGQRWWLLQRRMEAPPPGSSAERVPPPPDPDDTKPKYAGLVFSVAAPLEPVESQLRSLAAASAGISLALWLLVLLVSRWLSRRALAPVTQMALAARAMDAGDLSQRLPSPKTKDELDDLWRAFNDLLGRLEESFERQRRFTGDASHQLRTPLAAMLGEIEVTLRRDRSLTEYQETLACVHEQAEQLRQIVEMLLFLARADSEARTPNLEPLHLPSWLADHLRTWPHHLRAKDIQLQCPSDDSVCVEVHAPLLGQLVNNLLDNACKYSEPGTPIAVRVSAEAVDVALTIEDAGWGIASEDLPHVFEPFYRSVQARRQGVSGSGLGLAVAQRIATALGAVLKLDSEPGRGTRVTLYPLRRSRHPETPSLRLATAENV